MVRQELVDCLESVVPALSKSSALPAFQQLVFSGDGCVRAFDGSVSIARAVEGWPVVGGVPGRLLYDLLQKSKARKIEVTQKDKAVEVKLGTSRLTLPVDPQIEVPNKPVIEDLVVELSLTERVREHLESVLAAATKDTSVGVFTGVFLWIANGEVLCAATDNQSIHRAKLTTTTYDDTPLLITLQVPLVELLVATAKRFSGVENRWLISTSRVELIYPGVCVVQGACEQRDEKKSQRFLSVYQSFFNHAQTAQWTEIPKALKSGLERSQTLLSFSGHQSQVGTQVSVGESGELGLFTESAEGKIEESVKFVKSEKIGADCTLKPSLMLRTLPFVQEVAWQDAWGNNSVLFRTTDQDFFAVVAVLGKKEQSAPSAEPPADA